MKQYNNQSVTRQQETSSPQLNLQNGKEQTRTPKRTQKNMRINNKDEVPYKREIMKNK